MLHVRNTAQQDCEATVVKANRKHQIVLNMEVKRIEMEKKMRERYFCFEMSLMKARRLKIIDRQKSLGIFRPHTMENAGNDPRKEMQTKSFFFTQSVAKDSKVKLPPVSERRRTIPGFPMKLAHNENSRKISMLSKNINHNNFFDKERAKRLHPTGKMRVYQDENGQSKTQSKAISKSRKLDKIKEDDLGKNKKHNNGGLSSSAEILNKDLIIEKDQSQLQLDGENIAVDNVGVKNEGNAHEVKEDKFSEEDRKGTEHDDSNCSNTGGERSEENDLTGNLQSQPSPQKIIQAEMTSVQTQKISDFPSYQELQAWRRSLETRILNSGKDFKATNRLKSASLTGYRKDIDIHEACAINVRPQSA